MAIRYTLIPTLFVLATAALPLHVSAEIKTGAQLTQAIASQVNDISTQELQAELDSSPELVLIDIRMPSEIQSMGGAIKAAQNTNIARGWLEFSTPKRVADKNTPIVVYCGANIRSPLAAHTLQQMGYTNVRNYADGYIGWRKAGLAIE